MNNLTENQRNAKQQAFLDNQQAQMIERYEKADKSERSAIIRQIDSFLPMTKCDEKSFWLKFRQKLERINEKTV